MRTLLLCGATALAGAAPGPAMAFDPPAASFAAERGANVRIHRQGGGEWSDGDRNNRGGNWRRGHGRAYGYSSGYYEPGQWARYNNRSWESDSFNDWWHEQPNRSMPRWTQQNRRECKQQYWTSSGWTC